MTESAVYKFESQFQSYGERDVRPMDTSGRDGAGRPRLLRISSTFSATFTPRNGRFRGLRLSGASGRKSSSTQQPRT